MNKVGDQKLWFANNPSCECDLFINCLGYESRAMDVSRNINFATSRRLTFQFPVEVPKFSYENNRAHVEEIGSSLIREYGLFLKSNFEKEIANISKEAGRKITVCVDITSMNRKMMMSIIIKLRSLNNLVSKFVILYTPSKFIEKKQEFPRIDKVGSDFYELSGYASNPDKQTALIMGLGYEYGVSVGIINQLEPKYALFMRAIGGADGFEESVRKANLGFDFSGFQAQLTEFNINDPIGIFTSLENTVSGLSKDFRVILIPMGPKILACMMGLIALEKNGEVALWHVGRQVEFLESEGVEFCTTFDWEMKTMNPSIR